MTHPEGEYTKNKHTVSIEHLRILDDELGKRSVFLATRTYESGEVRKMGVVTPIGPSLVEKAKIQDRQNYPANDI